MGTLSKLHTLIDDLQCHVKGLQEDGVDTLSMPALYTLHEPALEVRSTPAKKPLPVERVQAPVAAWPLVRMPDAPTPDWESDHRLLLLGEPTHFKGENKTLLDGLYHALGFAFAPHTEAYVFEAGGRIPESVKGVIVMGQHALNQVTDHGEKLMLLRGKLLTLNHRPLMPSYPPSNLRQNRTLKKVVWKDMLKFIQHLDLKLPEWSAKYQKK